jgi:hypothetical protein
MIEVKQGQMFHDKVHLSSKVCKVPYVMVRIYVSIYGKGEQMFLVLQ